MESWRARVHSVVLVSMENPLAIELCFSHSDERYREVRGHIDRVHCFSAVGSALPARAAACKGGGVHSLKSHVSWVKNGANLVWVLARTVTSGHILLYRFSTRKADKPAFQTIRHEIKNFSSETNRKIEINCIFSGCSQRWLFY